VIRTSTDDARAPIVHTSLIGHEGAQKISSFDLVTQRFERARRRPPNQEEEP
jgi:hypothetical protein